MEKGGWAQPAARRELDNFLLSSALLLGTARAQGRRLPVLLTLSCVSGTIGVGRYHTGVVTVTGKYHF